jgi:hypothetical protein
VATGNSLLDPQVTERVLARLRGQTMDDGDAVHDLTPQKRKILASP